MHDIILCYIGCHLGRDKTVEKVSSRLFWRDMNADIREFIQCCDKCQRMNPKFNKAAATLHPIPVKAQVWNQVRRKNADVLIRVYV